MSKGQSQSQLNFSRAIKKFFLSSFVVFTFVAYVIHQRLTNPDSTINVGRTNPNLAAAAPAFVVVTGAPLPTDAAPQAPATPTPYPIGAFKDGTFTGPPVDAYYGLVKVQATIQNGKIQDVQFLEFPNDRRTSVRINSFAVPYLQQEAIQSQTPYVDIISGATLTSEAFMVSLKSALDSAKN